MSSRISTTAAAARYFYFLVYRTIDVSEVLCSVIPVNSRSLRRGVLEPHQHSCRLDQGVAYNVRVVNLISILTVCRNTLEQDTSYQVLVCTWFLAYPYPASSTIMLPNLSPTSAPTTLQVLAEVALEAIRGRLVGTRLSLVRAAFTRLRGSGDAPADAAPAVNVVVQFDPTGHPDVIAGRRPPEVRRAQASCVPTGFRPGFVTGPNMLKASNNRGFMCNVLASEWDTRRWNILANSLP